MAAGRPRVVVAGGSLGGLTAALHLRDVGCDVVVYERSRAPLKGRGAGIVLHPSTVRYLTSGGTIKVPDVSTRADRLRYLNRDGSVRYEEECRYRFTSYYTLYRGLLGCLEPDRYRLGQQVVDFSANEDSVTVRLEEGSREECELLVFADGIHSTGRALLLPDVEPRYAGYVGWRGTVQEAEMEGKAFGALQEAIIYYVGPNTHILTYPIPDFDGSVEPGRRRINFVWYRNVADGPDLQDLMTDREGTTHTVSLGPGTVRTGHMGALFAAARAELPEIIAETVVRSREPFVQVVFDVEVDRMAFGRTCLIGDAAFAIRPHAAAGTAKAAEDAFTLAETLSAAEGDVLDALRRWEPGQLALGRQVLERARDIGDRSQFLGTYTPPDPYLSFGLYRPGDSWMPEEQRSSGH
jgi:2,6-dihydroxypyridine 3-monooxygenase